MCDVRLAKCNNGNRYKEKITVLQAAQAGASVKQQAALVEDKENVKAQ